MTNNNFLKSFIEYLVCMIFPNRCVFCNKITAPYQNICDKCKISLPRIEESACPKCGAGKENCDCSFHKGLMIDGMAAPFYYTGEVKKAIERFKFNGCRQNYKGLGDEMIKTVYKRYPDIKFDIVCFVPMKNKAVKKREYNQSALLAGYVAQGIGAEYSDSLLKKLYDTDNQRNLSWIERRGNLTGAFDVNDKIDIKGKNILLCDDIRTTGATLSECAKMLFLSDAESVYCLTAALTLNDKNKTQQ